MSSVVRIGSGDTIQIREGNLTGIGPQGPTGPSGPVGPQGDTGPQGLPGPTGQINDFYAQAHNVGNPQALGANTESLVSFPTVVIDQPSVVSSMTNFVLPVGLWMVRVALTFAKPSSSNASGWRKTSVWYDGTELEAETRNAIPDIDTRASLAAFVPVTAAGRAVQIKATHSDAVSLSLGAKILITRLGPGAQGLPGPQGDAGPVGPIGPTGPVGPPGSLVSNTTTFATIGG